MIIVVRASDGLICSSSSPHWEAIFLSQKAGQLQPEQPFIPSLPLYFLFFFLSFLKLFNPSPSVCSQAKVNNISYLISVSLTIANNCDVIISALQFISFGAPRILLSKEIRSNQTGLVSLEWSVGSYTGSTATPTIVQFLVHICIAIFASQLTVSVRLYPSLVPF